MRTFSQIILEMSFDAKKVINEITGLARPINSHLIKYYMFPTSSHKDHWIIELRTWFNDISDMHVKPRNKMLSYATYYKVLFEEPFEGISENTKKRRIETTLIQYPNEKTDTKVEDFDTMRNKIQEFYKDICVLISTDTFDGDIKSILEKHLKR